MQSQIGLIQLNKISQWTKKRERNALILYRTINVINYVRIPMPEKHIKHAWYKFYFYIKKELISEEWSRSKIISEINNRNMPAFHGGCSEIYLEKCFIEKNFVPNKRLPIAKKLGESSIMLLIHPTIDEKTMANYANTVYEVLLLAEK